MTIKISFEFSLLIFSEKRFSLYRHRLHQFRHLLALFLIDYNMVIERNSMPWARQINYAKMEMNWLLNSKSQLSFVSTRLNGSAHVSKWKLRIDAHVKWNNKISFEMLIFPMKRVNIWWFFFLCLCHRWHQKHWNKKRWHDKGFKLCTRFNRICVNKMRCCCSCCQHEMNCH